MDDLPPVLQRPLIAPPIIASEGQLAEAPNRPPSDDAPLTAGRATVILLVFLGIQLAVGLMVGMAGGVVVGVLHGVHHSKAPISREAAEFAPYLILPAAFLGTLAGGLAMVQMSVSLARGRLIDCRPTGSAWVYGSMKANARGLAVGVVAAVFCLLVNAIFSALGVEPTLSPLTKMMATPGLSRLALIALMLFFAPPIEELLFRGVLYAGYRRSFGAQWAALLTTVIFVALHLPEIIRFPPGSIGLAGLATAALWVRLRAGAIGPAVAVHFAYNLVIVSVTVFVT